uniref:Myb-like protein P n=1 Tax=Tanacetum cinerariifolium TaxID=118510 RepID=A0A699HLG3_TANCI|nr:myb-like protein P [Tanacetum cinerariifolium]
MVVNVNPPPPPVNVEKPFGVTNIKSYIPFVLDLDQLNYDAWCELFTSHCHSFGVHGLLDGIFVCTSDNAAEWKKLDSLVKVWCYDTISTSLLQTVLKKNVTVQNVWKSLEDLFHDKKEVRAMELHEELWSLELDTLSIAEYFKRIKVVSDLLSNIESPVDEKNLVMYAVNGLGDKYDHVARIILHFKNPLTLLETRYMLLSEESRLNRKQGRGHTRDTPSSPTVLMATGGQEYQTRRLLLRCDSTEDLYPFHPSTSTTWTALFSSNQSTWHQRLGHPGDDVLRFLASKKFISCNTTKSTTLCNACQLDGMLSRYKAQLVANGKNQQLGVDCDDTFSLVVKPTTILTVLSLTVSHQWLIHQLDVNNAFLYGHLTETVYIHQPPGFTDPIHPDYACHLQRSLYGMKQAPGAWTPVDTEKKLGPEGSPVADPTLYCSLAEALQYLTFTRPDLSYAVQQLCLYMHDPPYSDADWAGCPSTRRSTLGYCVFLGNNLLIWSSKHQETLSSSSAEAKYRGVANVVAETSWIRNLLRELHTPLSTATLVYCDNGSYLRSTTSQMQQNSQELDLASALQL